MQFFQKLTDICNHEHWGISADRTALLKTLCRFHGAEHHLTPALENHLAHLHSVTFMNSLCIIHKKPAPENILGRRTIRGDDAIVNPARGGQIIPDESKNPYSDLALFDRPLPEVKKPALRKQSAQKGT